MAKRRLAPYVVLVALLGLAAIGHQLRSYDIDPTIACNYRLANHDAPAADVLFIGNSRFGASIDPAYLADRLSSAIGRRVRVERLALLWSDVPSLRLMTAEYVRNRGFPRHVVLMLSYNRIAAAQPKVDAPVHVPRSIAFGDVADLYAIQRDAVLNSHGAVVSRRLEQGFRSFPAVLLDKLTMNIYGALRAPAHALGGRGRICDGDGIFKQSDRWPYRNLSDALLDQPVTAPPAAAAAAWRAEVAGYLPLSPSSPMRVYETDQLQQLIGFLAAGGSAVHLGAMPSYSETRLSRADRDGIAAAFPAHDFIDVFALFDTPRGAELAQSYRDSNHVNARGAVIVSQFFADQLARRVE
jgi:hypothetical protein